MNIITGFKIRSEIALKLKSGFNKNDIYNSVVKEHGAQPIFGRILDDIPSIPTQEKYSVLIKFLLFFLSIAAFAKGCFLVLGIIKYSVVFDITMVTSLLLQIMMIWMVYRISRTGLLATAVVTGLYFSDYQKGVFHDDINIKLLYLVLMASSCFIIAFSVFLYFKLKENWKAT